MEKLFWIPPATKDRVKTDSMKSAIETHGMKVIRDSSSSIACSCDAASTRHMQALQDDVTEREGF